MKKAKQKGMKRKKEEWTEATSPPVKVGTTTISNHPVKPLMASTATNHRARVTNLMEDGTVLVEIPPVPTSHPANATKAKAIEVKVIGPMEKDPVRNHDDTLLPMHKKKSSKKPTSENCRDPKQHRPCDGQEKNSLIGRNLPPIEGERREEDRDMFVHL